MAFTAQDVKKLREMTNCGMMDCKKALTETDGDMDKAIEFLREKGLATAAKKAGRIASEGMVEAYVFDNGVGVAVEVNSETDFVAKNADFQNFVHAVAQVIADTNPADVEDLKTRKINDTQTVGDALTEKIATIGENMNIRRFERFEGINQAYIHAGGRIGVLVNFELADASKANDDAFKTMAKDVAMQIAAVSPQYVREEEVPADVVEHEKEILKAQALNEGKPEAIVEKMVVGRIKKFFKDVCLVDQPFVKDQDMTVAKYVDGVAKNLGTDIKIVKFARLEKGEGLEKKEENFADEVAKMIGK
ncbi:translation elongation factor Ts [Ructibacterium gallinarum]|uniref:Elongation factor Ts n=1 Tax=Ructibacterium gallinarum TaxID=2779355 RepID=A0A9D5R8C9_9FIRM|nr:translation elongation factor Ts [Ructibacterium gallinarum]MBE5039324.1 elongation factor Ts [Ructibacterium gallinarum]